MSKLIGQREGRQRERKEKGSEEQERTRRGIMHSGG